MNKNVDDFQKRRAQRQKKIRRRRIKTTLIVMLFMALITVAILCLTVFFPVKSITAKGSGIYSSAEIVKHSGITTDNNVFTFSSKRVTERLQKKLPYIDSVEIKRNIMGEVKISVKDANEYICYYIKGNYYTVSRKGWVLKKYGERPEGITMINCENVVCRVGESVVFNDEGTKTTLETMLKQIDAYKISTDEINLLNPLEITIIADGRFSVNLGTNGSIDKKLAHLSGMIKEIAPERSGFINLSMWTPEKTEGTFIEGEISKNS